MSSMIRCDGCKRTFYDDSRSEKGSYFELWINRSYQYHLCRKCYSKMMVNILHRKWKVDEQQWVEV